VIYRYTRLQQDIAKYRECLFTADTGRSYGFADQLIQFRFSFREAKLRIGFSDPVDGKLDHV
jgi:hypothetical protein